MDNCSSVGISGVYIQSIFISITLALSVIAISHFHRYFRIANLSDFIDNYDEYIS